MCIGWMWDPNTNGIHETHDIIWLKRVLFEKPKPTFKVVAPIQFDPDDPQYGNKEAGDNFEFREGQNEDDDKSGIADTEPTNMADEEAEALNDVQKEEETMTRSRRVVTQPTRLIKEMGTCSYEISLSAAKQEYYNTMWKMSEMALVGAGIRGGFTNMNELHVMKYKEAMAGKNAEK